MSGAWWLRLAAISGALAVVIGAFGAHGLEGAFAEKVRDGTLSQAEADRSLKTYETGVRYQMYHVPGLLAVGLLGGWLGRDARALWRNLAGWCFLAGIVLFSGSLYLLTLTGQRWLGMVAPLGGVAYIVGWILLAAAVAAPEQAR